MNNKNTEKSFTNLLNIVRQLRGPDGCPWDKEQTHESLLPYFLEEVYEVIEGVESGDMNSLKEELGDILLHVVLQADIAQRNGEFAINDSLNLVNKKLVHRHPHVFGDHKADGPFHAKQNWESAKHKEKNRESRLDGVPASLPALTRAQRLQEKASYTGFDWEKIEQVWGKINEEIQELKEAQSNGIKTRVEEEIGDVIFSVVNLARFLNISAEAALRKTNRKFTTRFKAVEDELKNRGKTVEDSNFEEMDTIWNEVKK
jgi:MazG family protein